MPAFDALGVPPTIRQALDAMEYHEATPVQEKGLPPILAGKDVLLEAQTGSGKTAAFGIPAVVVGSAAAGLRVLVLVPTRELARQVAEELRAIGTGSPFRAVAVTGGVHAEKEERTLAGDVRCIIATPGRLLALLKERRIRLDKIHTVILDEADRMLDMGFRSEVEEVLEAASARKQTVLVSATLPDAVMQLAERHLKDPLEVRASARKLPPTLAHYRLNVLAGQKEKAILALLQREKPERAIVFVHTRGRATKFAKLLKLADLHADALQGEMSHEQRRHVFDLFSRGTTHILVATDIASRGLDVPEMQLVVNVDLPEERGAYTHRAGRAARLGREGRVVNLVLPSEKALRERLEEETGAPWTPYRIDAREIEATPLPPEKPRAPDTQRRKGVKLTAKGTRKGAAKKAAAPDKRTASRSAPPRGATQRGAPARGGKKAAAKDAKVRPPRGAPERGELPPSRKERRARE